MADVTAKICTSCHKILPLEAFHINKRGKHGRESKCKKCKLSLQAIHRSKPEVRARIKTKDAERWRNNTAYRERELARRRTPEVKERQRKATERYKASLYLLPPCLSHNCTHPDCAHHSNIKAVLSSAPLLINSFLLSFSSLWNSLYSPSIVESFTASLAITLKSFSS